MDRKKFQNMFQEIDEFLIASICDDIELCEEIDYPIYSRYFYPPQITNKLKDYNIGKICFAFCGLTEGCEKNMLAILPEGYSDEDLNFPIKFFKIINKSKFKELEHKHYLGTILSLGIKRELLGDLIVEENICYGVTTDEIYDLIVENIKEIAKNPVEIEEIASNDVPNLRFEDIIDSVASLRLDNIVPILTNTSRSVSTEFIDTGDVTVNYVIEKEKSRVVKEGDIITIRKKGKFIFSKVVGENKKGKLRILLKKFI